MKFTNVKQLIIKFMGGGLINFPTRFLRWVKINGDTDDSDDGGGDSGGGGGDSTIKFGEALSHVCFFKNQTYGNPDAFVLVNSNLFTLDSINLENPINVGGKRFDYAFDANSENCKFKTFDELVQDDFSDNFNKAYFCWKLEKIDDNIQIPLFTLYNYPHSDVDQDYYYKLADHANTSKLIHYNEEYYLVFEFEGD